MSKVKDAWVELPTEAELREMMPGGGPYDFGFVPAMGRLIMSHPGIGPHFGALFQQIMFEPRHLDRREREMIAGVAAAAQDCHY